MDKTLFYSVYKARCGGCGEPSTLDSLIDVEDVNFCKDCIAEAYIPPKFTAVTPPSVFQKLCGWLFG
jgi:hypothetical protein